MDAPLLSATWFALEKSGEKRKAEKVRDDLPAGGKIPVDLQVTGTVGGAALDPPLAIAGDLLVGHDGTTNRTKAPPIEALLALVLRYVPKTRRGPLRQEIVQAWQERDRQLPEADPDCAELAEALVRDLTYSESSPRRGSVSFEFTT